MSRSCRPLSPFELVHAVVCETTVLTLRISGPLDAQALQTAWRYVVAANPVLCGRIEFGTAGLELVTDGTPAEPVSIGRVDPVEHSTTPVAFGQPVAGLDLTSDGEGGHWVSLFNHHAIADGTLTYFWYRSLWQHYREIIAGATTFDEEVHPVPESPEAVLAGRGVGKLDRSGAERLDGVVVHPFRDPVGRTPGTDPFALHRVVTVFSAEETAALRAAAKSRNATLHGFICAAILFAERELLEPDGALAIGLISPVDIRKWLTPPVGETEGTNIQGHSFAEVTIDLLDDPRSVGVEILRQLHTDLDEGVVLQTCLHIQETVQRWAANDSLEPISVSNMGEFTKLPLPEDLTVQEFHVRGSAHYGVLAGGGPPENLPLSTGRHHSVFSYDGRLNVQTNYPAAVLSAERTQHFANRVRTHLLAMLQAP
ncbi:phthiocerol/phthiodiolone dimycocerosyl transferase family protein [Mycobacterium sp. C31M]